MNCDRCKKETIGVYYDTLQRKPHEELCKDCTVILMRELGRTEKHIADFIDASNTLERIERIIR